MNNFVSRIHWEFSIILPVSGRERRGEVIKHCILWAHQQEIQSGKIGGLARKLKRVSLASVAATVYSGNSYSVLTWYSLRESEFLHCVHCLQCIECSVPSEMSVRKVRSVL